MNVHQPRKVKVTGYNPDWPRLFYVEAESIRAVLGDLVTEIYHIGSTSIPRAAAKPIIDIMPVVTNIRLVDSFNLILSDIGYISKGEYGIPGRRFFIKDTGRERTHHLHIFQMGNPEILRHLACRDYLCSHPYELAAYSHLKTELARAYAFDIEGYMDGKDAFIKEIDRKAAREQSSKPRAILLLGPTGSGKTPLGELLEKEGLAGHRCVHFDFGSKLRYYAARPSGLLSGADLAVVTHSLHTGALLTDEQFSIAEKLLRSFAQEKCINNGDLIVLNGLPRHAGQAVALENIVRMSAVVVLACDAETVMERISTDSGGDRGGRIDDTIESVKRKLEIYTEKTLPLVAYYQERRVPVLRVEVGPCDSALVTRDTLANGIGQILGQSPG